jgi:outer membrane lipoprotein SlyB
MQLRMHISVAILVLASMAGCASKQPESVMSTQGTTLVQLGQVIDVRDITVRGGRPSGIGAAAGAVLGGIAGSTIGSGNGSTVASIGGALAGGMAGQRAEESAASNSRTAVTIRLESGETRTVNIAPGEKFRIGDTVKVTTAAGVTSVTH